MNCIQMNNKLRLHDTTHSSLQRGLRNATSNKQYKPRPLEKYLVAVGKNYKLNCSVGCFYI